MCFDSDNDGDVDIFTLNRDLESASFYRNNSDENINSVVVRLKGTAPNSQAVGARIIVKSENFTQMREITIGSSFTSQNPTEQYFGFANDDMIDELRVDWPDGKVTTLKNLAVNDTYIVTHPNHDN